MKIIEIHQEDLIVCDNPACDFKIKNPTGDPNTETFQYINMPCPMCGENLLTEKDYIDHLKVMQIVNRINKWFGWLAIFKRKKSKTYDASVKVHNGIKIDHL